MPTIKPLDINDCQAFIKQHSHEIRRGIYDVEISDDWVKSLGEDILTMLAHHCPTSQGILASNDEIPAKVLSVLARNENIVVRGAVARNPHTPEVALNLLARDLHVSVRAGVLENPNISPKTLECLADPGKFVTILELFREDYSSRQSEISAIRRQVANHPKVTTQALQSLAHDGDLAVRDLVAKHSKATAKTLETLAHDGEEAIRSIVAANPNTPMKVMERLSRDKEGRVRASVAANPNTPTNLLHILGRDSMPLVRRAVAGNPNTPVGLLEILAREIQDRVRGWGDDRAYVLPIALMKNPRTPVETRVRVARIEEASKMVLDILAEDTNEEVRLAATESKARKKKQSPPEWHGMDRWP